MSTVWVKRVYAALPIQINDGQKRSLAQAFSVNGSMQSVEQEMDGIDGIPGYSSDGLEPVTHKCFETGAKENMAQAIKAIVIGMGGDVAVMDRDNLIQSFDEFLETHGLKRIAEDEP